MTFFDRGIKSDVVPLLMNYAINVFLKFHSIYSCRDGSNLYDITENCTVTVLVTNFRLQRIDVYKEYFINFFFQSKKLYFFVLKEKSFARLFEIKKFRHKNVPTTYLHL